MYPPKSLCLFCIFFWFYAQQARVHKRNSILMQKFEMATSLLEDLCISGFVRWNVCSFQKWKETSEVLLACNSGENGTQRNIMPYLYVIWMPKADTFHQQGRQALWNKRTTSRIVCKLKPSFLHLVPCLKSLPVMTILCAVSCQKLLEFYHFCCP